jgi:hypothetical protein
MEMSPINSDPGQTPPAVDGNPAKDKEQLDLEKMYQEGKRPLCPCRKPGVQMYIAKFGERYIVKRMPESGKLHAPKCDHYEPPPELSGLGDVLGSAIKENIENGMTMLRFDFSLMKVSSNPIQNKGGEEGDSVKTDGNKLSLRSTLHYLWEEAGFNKWSPAMVGKRSWAVVRKHILKSAETKMVKGAGLTEKLYIPEIFSTDKKQAINQRRTALLSRITAGRGSARQLGMLIGAVKDILPSRYGHKIMFKHSPDFPFMLNDDIYERLQKRYANELELKEAFDTSNLIAIATFGVSSAGVASIEEISLMLVTENWIPYEDVLEKTLIETLTSKNRRFVKGLRYNLSPSKPLASVVLSDTLPLPTAMYIVPAESEEKFTTRLDALKADSLLASWTWFASEFEMPGVPPAA